MENEGKAMNKKKAAPWTRQRHGAYLSTGRDIDSLADFERSSMYAAIIIGVAFGLIFFCGLM